MWMTKLGLAPHSIQTNNYWALSSPFEHKESKGNRSEATKGGHVKDE